MPPGSNPSVIPVGTTGEGDYVINNDYLFPGYTIPVPLRDSVAPANNIAGAVAAISPYTSLGLLRGWIYPIDVNTTDYLAIVGADAGTSMTDALARAAEEREEADAAAAAAGGDTTTETETVASSTPPVGPYSVVLNNGEDSDLPKKIRYREGKQFQFNPFSVGISIEMTSAAPAETQQQGGTAGTEQIGGATTSLELFFDRTIDTYAATVGLDTVNGYKIDPIFKDIGVQKDLWDVYRIILGGDADYFKSIGQQLVNIDDIAGMKVQEGSVTDMTTRLFDLGISGASAWGRRIAVFYNPNLVIIGDVQGIGFTYAEFNANYVPIKAKLDLQISILHTTSESGVDTFTGATPATDGLPGADGSGGIPSTDTPTATAYVPPTTTIDGQYVV